MLANPIYKENLVGLRGSTGQKSQKKFKKIFLHLHCSNIIRIQCIKLNVFMMHTDTNIVS